MLAIGRALMARPSLVMLDEPSMGLAPLVVKDILLTVERIAAGGTTVLLVEQNARSALKVARRGYVLENGRWCWRDVGGAAGEPRRAARLSGERGDAMNVQADREAMDRKELEQLQLERLEATLNRVQRSVPFYQRRFAGAGFDAEGLRSLADLRRLPLTEKRDLRDTTPTACSRPAAGRGARPRLVGDDRTRHRRGLHAERPPDLVRPGGPVLVAGGVGKTTWCRWPSTTASSPGPSGSTRARSGWVLGDPGLLGQRARQVGILKDYRSTALVCTPSHAMTLAMPPATAGIRPGELSLRFGLFGAEPWSESMRAELQAKLKLVPPTTTALRGGGRVSPASAWSGRVSTWPRTTSSSR